MIKIVCDSCDREMPVLARTPEPRFGSNPYRVVEETLAVPVGWVQATHGEHVCPRCVRREEAKSAAELAARFRTAAVSTPTVSPIQVTASDIEGGFGKKD
jgi:hypothetical protein